MRLSFTELSWPRRGAIAQLPWLDWQTLVRDFADSELADEALGQLAARAEQREGCAAALPSHERLRERTVDLDGLRLRDLP